MKVKEVDRTANIAWSPAAQHPIYLAAGTAAQQLDATFSTTAALEIYGLNLTEPGFDMSLKGSIVSEYRFHNVAWGCHGMTSSDKSSSGVIVGGADGGNLIVYDPSKILSGNKGILIQKTSHTGPVRALDFNPHKSNLLASGSSDSEIYIWDLINPAKPMTPGSKSQPLEDVTCVAWNCQVQHILASTFPGRCVVWDLRKNEPIIKVSDTSSRLRCKEIAWHPAVATQLCIASEDDQSPVIQLWDLRFATSPLKVLENHQRGVLSLAWCKQDPDLLISCGKDSRILCWNPNSNVAGGEIVCELNTNNQWSFSVAWCERNPAVIASSSFDGHVGIYSLMGGQQQLQPSSKITDAFPGFDTLTQPPVNQLPQRNIILPLKKPPKWLRKPVGASFSFGGKLVSFDNKQEGNNKVTISQVASDESIMLRSSQLESSLTSGNFADYCKRKQELASNEYDKTIWAFLMVNFEDNPKFKALALLGYNPEELSKKIKEVLNVDIYNCGIDAEELANRMSTLSTVPIVNSQQSTPSFVGSQTPENSRDISRDAFDAIAESKSNAESPTPVGFPIPVDDEINGMISRAILVGNIEYAVNLCLQDERMADALVLAMAGGDDLWQLTQKRYLKSSKSDVAKLITAVATDNWKQLVVNCDIMYWKEALSAILTYGKKHEFCELCEILGKRLETERSGELSSKAAICYICSGNLESFVACSSKKSAGDDSAKLQDLMEQVLIMERAVEVTQIRSLENVRSGPLLSDKLSAYAKLLATQGQLLSAFSYLSNCHSEEANVLKDRIFKSISDYLPGVQPPVFPYRKTSLQPSMEPRHAPHIQKNIPRQTNKWSINKPAPTSNYYGGANMPMSENFVPSYPNSSSASAPAYSGLYGTQSTSIPNSTPHNVFQPSMPTPPTSIGQNIMPNSATPPPPPPSSSAAPSQKGHMSHRYPPTPQDPSLYSQSYSSMNQANIAPFPQQTFMQPNAITNSVPDQMLGGQLSNAPLSQPTSNLYNPYMPPTAPDTSQTPQVAQPTQFAPPPISASYGSSRVDQCWNDPPVLTSNFQHKKSSVDLPPAITQPIFNPNQPQDDPSVPAMNQYQNNMAIPPPGTQFNYGNQNFNTPPQQMQNNQQNLVENKQPPPPVVPKEPIPEKHREIVDVLGALAAKCSDATTNPQMRRKLEDVAKKLENLENKLRSNALSEITLNYLHEMVSYVKCKDYQAAIAVNTNCITCVNFSEISSFMPGIKVLLQVGLQLGVYYSD